MAVRISHPQVDLRIAAKQLGTLGTGEFFGGQTLPHVHASGFLGAQ